MTMRGGELIMTHASGKIQSFLQEHKSDILNKWFDLLANNYPAETQKLLKSNKGQFKNPVGHNFKSGLDGILDELINGMDAEKLNSHLDKIIRIQAVQDIKPEQALSFLFVLKKIIREEGLIKLQKNGVANNGAAAVEEILEFESKIDEIALMAFNIYLQCKSAVYEIRLDEVKKRCNILERVNMLNQNKQQS